MGAFSLTGDEDGYTLLMDGSWLDNEVPFRVGFDGSPVMGLGDDPHVRVRLTLEEGQQLWRLLDAHVGAHVREGEVVRDQVEQTRREGLDTALPSHLDYLFAQEALGDPELVLSDEERARHQEVVTVYERAHGLGTEGRSR
jgi:hypothetical protein